MFLLCK